MTHISRKFFSVLTVLIIIISIFSVCAGAYDAKERVSCFNRYGGEIVCVAHRGDWHSYPENSAEAVRAAAEYGVISVDIKITSDKKPVLMADDTTDRMCVDSDGKTVSGRVSDFTLAQLEEMYLRSSNGTVKNGKTAFHPASLQNALEAAGSEAALMLNIKCEDFRTVYSAVKSYNALASVIFRFTDKNKKIIETVNGITDITVCGNYQGNIIFLATNAVKKCRANGITATELGSANGHGVLYDRFLMKRFDSEGRAMVSMVNGRCGKRTDSEKGWDDLISRGYSIIETDYPAELCEYIERVDNAKYELERYIGRYENTDTAEFTTDTENAFKSSVDNGKKLVSDLASLSELEEARFNLQSSYDNLTVGAKKAVTLSFNLSAGRVVAAVLCGAAILISQILLYKRREKK